MIDPSGLLPKALKVTLCGFAIASAVNVHAEFYQWKDAEGNIHYSDHIPVEDTDYKQRVLDQEGQTVGVIEGKKTSEELEAERQARELKEQEERENAKRKAYDRALLATFQSITDLEIARDERLETIDSSMMLAKQSLAKHQTQLDELQQKRAKYEELDKPVPAWIEKNTAKLNEIINSNQEYLNSRRLERVKLADKFNRDIERFIELTAQR